MRVLVIGAGKIAPDYVNALHAIGIEDISVLSRTEASARRLADSMRLREAFWGGTEKLQEIADGFDAHIVASSIEALLPLTAVLAESGADRVLVEKPVALSSRELSAFLREHEGFKATVALNRMYFPSVAFLRERIASETVTSAQFSFCEWIHRIDTSAYSERELARWGASNCIHVIATLFSLIGLPRSLHPTIAAAGAVPWHPSGATFTGSGISQRGVPFAYASDWRSAGRWSITICTEAGAYLLSPMEAVVFTPRGSIHAEPLVAPYSGETKCGFVEMLGSWLDTGDAARGMDISELVPHLQAIEAIFGYD